MELININKPRLFVDMDGTLAEWRNINITLEEYEDISDVPKKLNKLLRTPGYFYSLNPNENVVQAIKRIIQNKDIDVYILSCCLEDSKDSSPKNEKNSWLDKYLPEIDKKHRIFVPDGEDKKDYVPFGIKQNDYLLDDYTANLHKWEEIGKGIKLLNGVNATNGTWHKNRISYKNTGREIADKIESIVLNHEIIVDKNIQTISEEFDYNNFDFSAKLNEIEDMHERC